jgi:hypothetical protein
VLNLHKVMGDDDITLFLNVLAIAWRRGHDVVMTDIVRWGKLDFISI